MMDDYGMAWHLHLSKGKAYSRGHYCLWGVLLVCTIPLCLVVAELDVRSFQIMAFLLRSLSKTKC